jgi:hypothetical protein
LSNKDWQEINSLLPECPEAKHQLCFWNCLCAIKHLSILWRTLAFYHVENTMQEFLFFNKSFVPVGQRDVMVCTTIHIHLSQVIYEIVTG